MQPLAKNRVVLHLLRVGRLQSSQVGNKEISVQFIRFTAWCWQMLLNVLMQQDPFPQFFDSEFRVKWQLALVGSLHVDKQLLS